MPSKYNSKTELSKFITTASRTNILDLIASWSWTTGYSMSTKQELFSLVLKPLKEADEEQSY